MEPPFKYPDHGGSVAQWILRCPGQTPAWDTYVVSTVHLRDIPGVPPAVLNIPGASHEFSIWALDPSSLGISSPLEVLLTRVEGEGFQFLRPSNYVKQYVGLTDSEAEQATDLLAEAILIGSLPAEPPLSGGDYWSVFMERTIEHIQTHRHREPPPPNPEGFGRTKS
jgi:hypothetical protein